MTHLNFNDSPPINPSRTPRPLSQRKDELLSFHKILIVDDSRSTLAALKSQIESPQCSVSTALSVAEAWPILEQDTFDCILSDFEMPGASGPEFCQRIKADQRLASTPVIILTSLSHTENLLTAIDAGADDFISKDSDMKIIQAKIKAMIRIKTIQDEVTKLRRVEGIKQIIATYNHEFNNPLTIAVGNLMWLKRICKDHEQLACIERLHEALGRMSDVVKKIRELRDYVEKNYTGEEGMIDVAAMLHKRAV